MQKAIDFLKANDPIFQFIIEKYGVPDVPKRPEGFETLVLLILEQQVSIDSAKATFIKLKAKAITIEPKIIIVFSDETFRLLGISRQKTSYIKALSLAIINQEINLNSFSTKTAQQVREELIKIKGIGNWTIDIYLMFCLQAPNIIPLGDIAVNQTIKELLGIDNKQDIEAYISRWSPYHSMATYLLWHYYLMKRNRKVVY